MQAEAPGAHLLQAAQTLPQLLVGEAVLRFAGVAHDGIANLEIPAGVVAAAHRFGNAPVLCQNVDVGNIVQVDVSVHSPRMVKFLVGHGVGGEHHVPPEKPAGGGQGQLRVAGAVHPAALLLQDAKDGRVGQGLHGKVFLKILAPGKGLLQCPGVFADARLVVEVKRRGKHLGSFLKNPVLQRKVRHDRSTPSCVKNAFSI